MENQVDVLVAEEHRKDRLREAERQRLVNAVLAERPKPKGLYDGLLAGLGRSLTGWGLRLQARYGTIVEIPYGCNQQNELDQKTLVAKTETA